MEREFLGWERPPLEAAAEWLVERHGADLDRVLVALPGARSGRILQELLARRVGPALRPPRIVTAGLASDELLELEGTPAGRLERTLAWREALASLPDRSLRELVAEPPDRGDLAGWMRLAEEVRTLFGEVAAEGLDFAGVAADPELAEVAGERRRWGALAEAQTAMTRRIEEAGFVDPHLGRLRAIEAGRTRSAEELAAVVLVGVTELNALLRRSLEASPVPVTALVFAPPERRDAFDEAGGLIPEAWAEWRLGMDAERQWLVTDRPPDQARCMARVLAGWQGKYAAEEITVGLADRELAPYLRGKLAECGVTARDAAGVPVGRTAPAMLLAALSRFLRTESFEDLASLVRHPDLEAALRRRAAENSGAVLEPVGWVDAYHDAHLPRLVDGRWCVNGRQREDRGLAKHMALLWEETRALLGELASGDSDSLERVVDRLRRFLQRVYGDLELRHEQEHDRVRIAALSAIGDALAELERIPASLVPGELAARPAEVLDLLGRTISGGTVAPAAARAGEPTVELLGWLELALDDAPALIVTGFEEGKVPESVRGDAYLPDRLRRSLGLVDDRRRLARDLYATELLVRSREEVVFVTGRRNAAGDPQLPSRIVFHADEDAVVSRTRMFLSGAGSTRRRTEAGEAKRYELPRAATEPRVPAIGVTHFGLFLTSPYLYYLEKVLGLRSIDDRARELQPNRFGDLAHAVLQRFGESEGLRDNADESSVAAFLSAELEKLAGAVYGRHPLPAVGLQLRQLDYRLRRFAAVQAERAASGWRIHAVEWEPAGGSRELVVDGEPIRIRGRIDRIDFHPPTGRWAIWDYKTGEKIDSPTKRHRKPDGTWRDLQLPLYCYLAEELLEGAEPAELGYVGIAKEPSKIGFLPLEGWLPRKRGAESFAEGLESALDTAAEVVRRIRRRDFFTDEGFAPLDPILAAIGGLGLVADGGEPSADGGSE